MHLLGVMLNNNIFESVTLNCIYSYMQFKFKGWGMVTNNIVMLSHPNWPYLLSLKSAVSGHFFYVGINRFGNNHGTYRLCLYASPLWLIPLLRHRCESWLVGYIRQTFQDPVCEFRYNS